jgi:hypothetical protein
VSGVPPVAVVYQLIPLPVDTALRAEVPPVHIAAGVAEIAVGAAGIVLIVTEALPGV